MIAEYRGSWYKVISCNFPERLFALCDDSGTCWIDPKDFMPEANKNVLVKCSSGEIQTDFYAPELGGFFIEHSTHAKVTGWREMM